MRFFLRLSVSSLLFSFAIGAHAEPMIATTDASIIVTDQAHPVTNIPASARIIELDASMRLFEQLSANLPTDAGQAEQIAKERLSQFGKEFQASMQSALQGAVDAWQLGVAQIPAVVQDGFVVYGETDVGVAIHKIKTYQANQGTLESTP